MRGHRPPSPSAVPAPEEKAKGSKKDDKKKIPSPEPEPEPELDENGGCYAVPLMYYFISRFVTSVVYKWSL